jgi:hypothetical protein
MLMMHKKELEVEEAERRIAETLQTIETYQEVNKQLGVGGTA